MDGKQRGDESGAPESGRRGDRRVGAPAGQFPQRQEQEDGGGGMQQDVGQMMPARVWPVELPIHHPGHRRDRIPLVSHRIVVREQLHYSREGEALGDYGVLINAGLVVEIDERGAGGPAEGEPHDDGEEEADGLRQSGLRIRSLHRVTRHSSPVTGKVEDEDEEDLGKAQPNRELPSSILHSPPSILAGLTFRPAPRRG